MCRNRWCKTDWDAWRHKKARQLSLWLLRRSALSWRNPSHSAAAKTMTCTGNSKICGSAAKKPNMRLTKTARVKFGRLSTPRACKSSELSLPLPRMARTSHIRATSRLPSSMRASSTITRLMLRISTISTRRQFDMLTKIKIGIFRAFTTTITGWRRILPHKRWPRRRVSRSWRGWSSRWSTVFRRPLWRRTRQFRGLTQRVSLWGDRRCQGRPTNLRVLCPWTLRIMKTRDRLTWWEDLSQTNSTLPAKIQSK